jgi:hypothetical protein
MSWNAYLKYKSILQLPNHDWIEAFIRKVSVYDVLEFSIKFRISESGFVENPERYSIWKYDFNPEVHSAFIHEGFQCFQDFVKDTKADVEFDNFRTKSMELKEQDLRYFSFGTEISSDPDKTRLKTYAGYRSRIKPNYPFIIREELNLNGVHKSSKYDGYPTNDPRLPMIFPELSRTFETAPFIYCVYAETGRLHCKSYPEASDSVLSWIEQRFHGNSSTISTLIAQGFQIEVVTIRRSELIKNDLQSVTIYFRYGDWAKRPRSDS